jgi:anti-sigma regulatory factor (Ser/Thr protein kinase)
MHAFRWRTMGEHPAWIRIGHGESKGASIRLERPLARSPDAASIAREQLDRWLPPSVPRSVVLDVRLAATELVTNAVRHGRLRPEDMILLSVAVEDDAIHVEVQQPTVVGSVAVEPRGDGSGGFGLKLVEGVSDHWGVIRGPPGRVWCELGRW